MSRKRSLPKYSSHISGQACAWFFTADGERKPIYFGKHGTSESWTRYHALCQQYKENRFTLPEDEPIIEHQQEMSLLVRHVTAAYMEHANKQYAERPKEVNRIKNLCKDLNKNFGDTCSVDFGPLKLEQLRNCFIEKGWTRKYVNRMIREVLRAFKYATSRELIPVEIHTRLQMLEPLKQGFCQAPEGKKTQPVDLQSVRETANRLSPTLKAMIELQAATGMRPAEVCNLKPSEIEQRADGVWVYRPTLHKNSRRNQKREVPILGDVRITLGKFLNRDPDSFCFSPRESMAWFRQQQRKNRKTKVQPSQQNRRKTIKKREPGLRYKSTAYYRAIQNAAKKAKVDPWYPYQLRHTAATVVRETLGIEAAAALLGHARTDMTEVYAQVKLSKSIEAAAALTRLNDR